MKYDPTHDFTPLRRYCRRNGAGEALPWEYMGHDDNGNAHYRERENGNRLCLNPNGRLGCIHRIRTVDLR
jgi:hypothetical protein